jgi:hypothetical protein
MITRLLHMIGTSHHYQYGMGAKRGEVACTEAQESAFRDFAHSSALACQVEAIAEELNEEGLREAGKPVSVLQSLANDLDLPHLFCEPDRSERDVLGAAEETLIRMQALMNVQSEEVVQAQLEEQFRIRETVWLQRLEGLSVWPVLFVCGANHVRSFSARLAAPGVSVKVVHPNWQE